MDSTSETAPTHSDITNEVLSRVTDEFANPNSPYGRINQQRTAVTGDSWIRQPKQPPGTQISATNCCHGSHMDSTAQRSPRHSDITDELLSRVKDGFGSPNSIYGLRNHQRTAVTNDAWIRQPKQPYELRNHQPTAVTGDVWIRQLKQALGPLKSSTN